MRRLLLYFVHKTLYSRCVDEGAQRMSASTSSLLRGLDFMFNRAEKADSHNHVVVKGSSFIRQFLLICGCDEDTWIQN